MDNLLSMEHLTTNEIYELIEIASGIKMDHLNHIIMKTNL